MQTAALEILKYYKLKSKFIPGHTWSGSGSLIT